MCVTQSPGCVAGCKHSSPTLHHTAAHTLLEPQAELPAAPQALRERLLDEYQWDLDIDLSQLRGPSTVLRSMCPECHNGSQGENSFAVTVNADDSGRPHQILWCCHRQKCGFQGGTTMHGTWVAGQQQRDTPPSWQQALAQANKQQQQAWMPMQQQQQQALPVQQWQQRVQAPQQWMQPYTPLAPTAGVTFSKQQQVCGGSVQQALL